jgi:hypothetical protein
MAERNPRYDGLDVFKPDLNKLLSGDVFLTRNAVSTSFKGKVQSDAIANATGGNFSHALLCTIPPTPRYITLKPRWNKVSERLRGLKDTRDRLAHHTIYEGDQATTIKGDSSLRPSRFDLRQKSQKYQPLDLDQISKFSDSLIKVQEDLTVLPNSMTDLLTRETSQENSSEPTSDQHPP